MSDDIEDVYTDVMIDIETMATSPDAAVLSIGAVAFNPETGEMGPEFHEKIDFKEAMGSGRADVDTMKWWIQQDAEAGMAVTSGTKTNQEVMVAFVEYIQSLGNPNVWGNGATFDITILESAFIRAGIEKCPWMFWQIRDCRTVEALAEGICSRDSFEREGLHHDALDDAKYQATYISGMWQHLRVAKIETAAA